MGPFSREKGRGEVRGLKKKEVEEFVFVFFPDLKGGAIAKEKEGSASAFRCFRVFSFSLFNTSYTRCSARCEARKRKGGTQKAGAWRTKAFPFLLFFHQAKNRDKKRRSSHFQDLLLKRRLVHVQHRPDGKARRAGRRSRVGRPPRRREGGRVAADKVGGEGAAECCRGRRRGASSRGQRRRNRRPRSRPRGRSPARRRRVHRRHHSWCCC